MHKMRIDRTSYNFTPLISEFFGVIAEVNDLCRADKGEVKRVEEEQKPLVLVVVQRKFLELVSA